MTDSARPRAAVIGAGPMGLAVAYELAKLGHRVTIFERDNRIGGMSAHIDFDGTRLERYYHFVCAPDETTFKYLKEFQLEDRLHWTDTHMGFYYNGTLYDWGSPLGLLRFPGLTLLEKLRYALHAAACKVDHRLAPLRRLQLDRMAQALDRPEGVRRDVAHPVPLQVLRVGGQPLSGMARNADQAGGAVPSKHIPGDGSAISKAARNSCSSGSPIASDELGGTIELSASVESVEVDDSPARQPASPAYASPAITVRSTLSSRPSRCPMSFPSYPGLPTDEKARIAAIENVGIVCVLLKLKRPFTRNFWMNINDPRIEIPGLIEYSNVNPLDGSVILYAPFYMPRTHPKYRRDFGAFIEETLAAMQAIRPDFDRGDVIASTASRYDYSQTVCTPGFYAKLPAMRSQVAGLFLADTSHYYPEDRSISESLRLGAHLATLVTDSSAR